MTRGPVAPLFTRGQMPFLGSVRPLGRGGIVMINKLVNYGGSINNKVYRCLKTYVYIHVCVTPMYTLILRVRMHRFKHI